MNELTINLQTGSKIPLYEQIYNYVKENIQNGKLSSKEKLPSTERLQDIWRSAEVPLNWLMNS